MAAASRSFDPDSAGARHLARTWLPRLELWELRITREPIVQDDRILKIGDIFEVPATEGARMVGDGLAEVVSRRFVSAHH